MTPLNREIILTFYIKETAINFRRIPARDWYAFYPTNYRFPVPDEDVLIQKIT